MTVECNNPCADCVFFHPPVDALDEAGCAKGHTDAIGCGKFYADYERREG